jgi:hypothetical protein
MRNVAEHRASPREGHRDQRAHRLEHRANHRLQIIVARRCRQRL